MISDRSGEERSREGRNHMTSDMLGKERLPWGEVLVFPVFPVSRHLELSTLGDLLHQAHRLLSAPACLTAYHKGTEKVGLKYPCFQF